MDGFDISKVTLRALKIIRKSYKKNRKDPKYREKLKQINELIEQKDRVFTKPKIKKVIKR